MSHDYENYNLQQDELREDYITSINQLMQECYDVSLLDLLKKLLEKSV